MSVIKEYIDKSLDFVNKYREYLMYVGSIEKSIYNISIDLDMVHPFDLNLTKNKPETVTFDQEDNDSYMVNLISQDDKMWQPINGSVTEAQLQELESYCEFILPDDYKEYLTYKYFYQIFYSLNIRLYPKPKDHWIEILKTKTEEAREYDLAQPHHLVIGEYSDYGYIALNLKDEKIELLDHGLFEIDFLADNFSMLLFNALQCSEATINK